MICPHCGAALADGLQRCNCCGGTLNIRHPEFQQAQPHQPQQPQYQQPQQPQQPQFQQPQYQQPQYQQPQYQPPQQPQYQPPQPPYGQPLPTLKKKEFIRACGRKDLRIQWMLITVTMILSLALILGGALYPMLRPILRIPSVNGMLDAAGVDVDEVTDTIQEAYDELAREFELSKEELTDEEMEFVEKVLDSLDRLSGKFNLVDLCVLAGQLKDDAVEFLDEYLGAEELMVLDTVAALPALFIGAIAVSFLLPLIFALVAGLKKSLGFTITALVLSLLPQLIFNGMLFVVLTLGVFIPQAIFCGNTNKAYKQYKLTGF